MAALPQQPALCGCAVLLPGPALPHPVVSPACHQTSYFAPGTCRACLIPCKLSQRTGGSLSMRHLPQPADIFPPFARVHPACSRARCLRLPPLHRPAAILRPPCAAACRNVRWPLLLVMLCTCICILYGLKVGAWGLPHIKHGEHIQTSFQLCSFALSLVLGFRIKMVRGRRAGGRSSAGLLLYVPALYGASHASGPSGAACRAMTGGGPPGSSLAACGPAPARWLAWPATTFTPSSPRWR